jgi:hypothetical protein
MSAFVVVLSLWGVVTLALVVLLVYRARLESQESDWIPLTDAARDEKVIKAQTIIEMKAGKLIWPIRVLGTLCVLLLVAMFGVWLYQGLVSPPPR